jgi:hypothetical protein
MKSKHTFSLNPSLLKDKEHFSKSTHHPDVESFCKQLYLAQQMTENQEEFQEVTPERRKNV